MKNISLHLVALVAVISSVLNVNAQNPVSAEDSVLTQLKEVETLKGWVNDNLFPGLFDPKNPAPMMIFTEN